MEPNIDPKMLLKVRDISSEFSNLDDDYIFSHIAGKADMPKVKLEPRRLNGVVFCLLSKGYIDMEINMHTLRLSPNMLLTMPSSSIVDIKGYDEEEVDMYILALSSEFLKNVNIDISVLNAMPLKVDNGPTMELSDDEMSQLLRYLELIHINTINNQGILFKRSISRSLLAAFLYQLMEFAGRRHNQVDAGSDSDSAVPVNRRSTYVRDFFDLVHRYYKQQRSVAFYAERLFITPKYLSLVVKEATNRSAAEWIDEFVILEAKNLLRFSHKNIQQIAYELNFSNQSSFGKYFKNLTGMSPTAFQRS